MAEEKADNAALLPSGSKSGLTSANSNAIVNIYGDAGAPDRHLQYPNPYVQLPPPPPPPSYWPYANVSQYSLPTLPPLNLPSTRQSSIALPIRSSSPVVPDSPRKALDQVASFIKRFYVHA